MTTNTKPTAAVRSTTSSRAASSSATAAGVSAAALFPDWLPKIVMAKNYASQPRHHRLGLHARRRRRAEHRACRSPTPTTTRRARRSRFRGPTQRGDARHQSRRFLHVPAGDGRRCVTGVCRSGTGSAHRARDGADSTCRARTSTRSDTWKSASRSIRRWSRVGWVVTSRAFRRSIRRRRCAASASRTDCRRRSSARPQDAADRRPDELHDRWIEHDAGAARVAFMQSDYAGADEPVHSAALDATNTVDAAQVASTSPATSRRTARSIRRARSVARCDRVAVLIKDERRASRRRRSTSAAGTRTRRRIRSPARCPRR